MSDESAKVRVIIACKELAAYAATLPRFAQDLIALVVSAETQRADEAQQERDGVWRVADLARTARDEARAELERLRNIIAGARHYLDADEPTTARALLDGNGFDDGIAEELKSEADRLRDELVRLRAAGDALLEAVETLPTVGGEIDWKKIDRLVGCARAYVAARGAP